MGISRAALLMGEAIALVMNLLVAGGNHPH
jgi:hypothetical protein